MVDTAGKFVWYELATPDMAAAQEFYGRVVGWTGQDAGMDDGPYTILSAGSVPVGGLRPITPAQEVSGQRRGWGGYIAVADVDAACVRVTQAGGKVHRAADDIPRVGRLAVVADPQGGAVTLFRGAGAPPPPVAGSTVGHVGWHELHADDWDTALEFYAKMFGWTRDHAVDMGPMGTYQIFAIAGTAAGGMMNKPQPGPTAWSFYFTVAAIDAAMARVTAAGGTVVQGPVEVPGGMWIVQALDPQGVAFALIADRR